MSYGLMVVFFAINAIFLWCFHNKTNATQPTKPPQEITLHFGHQGVRDFYAYTHGESDDYPDIMGFFDLNWRPPILGIIHVKHFDSNTKIPHVFSAMGTKNNRNIHGIGSVAIHAGLSAAEFVTPEQAYQDYVTLITTLKRAGWQHYFEPFEARIAKEDNFKLLMYQNTPDVPDDDYMLGTGYSSDSTAILSFDEWQQVMHGRDYQNNLNSQFYFRDVSLWLQIKKTATKSNPATKLPNLEQYMVRYSFKNSKYKFYGSLSEDKTQHSLKSFTKQGTNWQRTLVKTERSPPSAQAFGLMTATKILICGHIL